MIKTQTCYTVACTSCGKEFEHEWIPHWPTAEQAREEATENEWVSNGALDLCDVCRYKPHPFVLEPDTTDDCWRCSNPAEEHDEPKAMSE